MTSSFGRLARHHATNGAGTSMPGSRVNSSFGSCDWHKASRSRDTTATTSAGWPAIGISRGHASIGLRAARSTNAHRGEALTCSGPRGDGYLRAGRGLLRTQRLDELRDRGADLVGAVMLQISSFPV